MAVSESLGVPSYHEVGGRARPRRREIVEWTDGELWTDAPRRRRTHEPEVGEPDVGSVTSTVEVTSEIDLEPQLDVLADEPTSLRLDEIAGMDHTPLRSGTITPAGGAAELDAPGRRTVVITGRGAERHIPSRRGYESGLRRHERSSFKPDRVAMWAFLLGLALLLGAVTSAHAAVIHAVATH